MGLMLVILFLASCVARTSEANRLLVGAIDFGTTYSGWACSFYNEFRDDPTKATVKQWYSGSGSLTTEKTPTIVLIKPDGKIIEAFGYEAENRYRALVDAGEHRQYFYFKKFKMVLNKKMEEKLDRDMTLEDEMGRSLPALDVFALAIEYLKNDMFQSIKYRLTNSIQESDVYWVLTVPAIWTDSARQFMREAANKAGIRDMNLKLALEPEAASLFGRNQRLTVMGDGPTLSVGTFKAGMRYLVLDAGGGTMDLTVHEVDKTGGVKEIRAANGGGWGGTVVDKAFLDLITDLFTKDVYDKFKLKETEDWLDLWREFETKKRSITPSITGYVNMKFPVSLLDLYKLEKGRSISDDLIESIHRDNIKFTADKMKLSSKLFKSLFDSSLGKTIDLVKTIISGSNVNSILMVGGYSESPMLEQAVIDAFPDLKVIIPKEASSAILRGALIFGHSPESVTERILRYTYGVDVVMPFRSGKHPEHKRIQTDIGEHCTDIFSKHAERDQLVKFGEIQASQSYTPLYKMQTQLSIPIFASELKDPEYTTDEGCILVGSMTVELVELDTNLDREVKVSLSFGGTEIIVIAEDVKTGRKTKASIDFLG